MTSALHCPACPALPLLLEIVVLTDDAKPAVLVLVHGSLDQLNSVNTPIHKSSRVDSSRDNKEKSKNKNRSSHFQHS